MGVGLTARSKSIQPILNISALLMATIGNSLGLYNFYLSYVTAEKVGAPLLPFSISSIETCRELGTDCIASSGSWMLFMAVGMVSLIIFLKTRR